MMKNEKSINITPELTLPLDELSFHFSRSGGAGGQNVNKVNTRVTLRFSLETSPSLSPWQKGLIREKLGARISQQGFLQVVASEHRTQGANREAALARFASLMRGALYQPRPRKKTRVPFKAKKRRLEGKKARAGIKRLRSKNIDQS